MDKKLRIKKIYPSVKGLGAAGTVLADWHVDGDIAASGDGTTLEKAFKTITEALVVWQAGESLWIQPKDDDSGYEETVTVPGAGCSVLSSGVRVAGIWSGGAKIDASNAIVNANFTKTGGRTNVYEIAISPELDTTKTWVNVWENGVALVRAADVATCDATAGSYLPSADTGATPITLYIHPPGSGNPISNGKAYRYTQRRYAIESFSHANVTINGIHTRRQLHEDGSIVVGRSSTVTNCQISDGSKHNVLLADGSSLTNNTIDGAYYNAAWSMAIFNEATPANLGITVTGNAFSNPAYSTNAGGFLCHKNTSGSFGAATISNNTFTNIDLCISELDITSMTVSGNTVTNCRCMLRVGVAITYTLSNNVDTSTGTSPRAIETNVAGATINITNDTYTLDTVQSGGIAILHANTTLSLTNSDIIMTGGTATIGCILVNSALAGCSVTVNGSTIQTAAGNNYRFLAAPTYVGNNNAFKRALGADGTSIRNGGTTYSTIADWRTASGQDAQSTG